LTTGEGGDVPPHSLISSAASVLLVCSLHLLDDGHGPSAVDCSRTAASKAARARVMQRAYWVALQAVLNRIGGPVSGNKRPQPQSWMDYPIGRSRFNLAAVMIRPKKRIRADDVSLGTTLGGLQSAASRP
jgi:hypothetical protein